MRLMLLGNHGPFAFGSALRAAVWTPAQLPSLVLWLDAEDSASITLNGSTVSQWSDKSGGERHFTQVTAAFQPAYLPSGFNSRPAIENVSDDFLELSSSILGRNVGGLTCAIVGSHELGVSFTATGYDFFIGSGAGATRFLLTPSIGNNLYSIGGRRLDSDAYGTASSSTDALANRGNPWIRIGQRAYSDGVANHWTNGVQDMTNAVIGTQGAGNTSDTNSYSTRVFAGSTNTAAGTKMTEVIVTHSTMSNEDRQKLEGYLAWKWGGDALWTPAQLTNLAMWLDAADTTTITLNGPTVSQWNDKSGNGRHAVQANAANQPTFTTNALNSLPVITFDSLNDDGFSLSGTTIPVPKDAFSVSQGYGYLYSSSNPDDDSRIAYTSSNLLYWSTAGNSPADSSTPLRNVNDVFIEHYSGQNTSLNEVYINGSVSQSFTTTSAWVSDNRFNQIGLRWGDTTGLPTWNGIISEVIFTSSLLSEADRQRVEGYLAWKWGGI